MGQSGVSAIEFFVSCGDLVEPDPGFCRLVDVHGVAVGVYLTGFLHYVVESMVCPL